MMGQERERGAVALLALCVMLAVFYLAYRLNRDEGIIVTLQGRVAELENSTQSAEKFEEE